MPRFFVTPIAGRSGTIQCEVKRANNPPFNLIDPIPAYAGMTKKTNPPRHCVTPIPAGGAERPGVGWELTPQPRHSTGGNGGVGTVIVPDTLYVPANV